MGRHKQPHPSCDWWTGIGSNCRPGVLSWQQVLEFSQCQSALIMMPASQLRSDDLRNVRQALVMHYSFNILPAIKHFRPDPGLGRLLPERISRIEVPEGGRAFRR